MIRKNKKTYLNAMEDKEWDDYCSQMEQNKREDEKKNTVNEKKQKSFIKAEKLRYISNN